MPLKPLRDYQIDDLAFYIQNERCANLSDPGAGKTPSACVYMQYLWQDLNAKSIFMMPKSLLYKNKVEMHNFTDLTDEQVVIVDGTPKEREKQMRNPNAVVFLMGFKRFADDWEYLRTIHPTLNALIIDEFQMGGFKNPESKRSKALFKAMRSMKYFLPMSGTLISGRLDSCYSAIHVIEPRYYANHYSFLVQHALMDEYGTVIAWINHEKIGRIFMRHCIRRTFESIHGEQAKVIINELVQMDSKCRAAYKEFEQKALLELEDKFLDGGNPAVHAMRCRQIMGHPHTLGLLKENELSGKEQQLEIHVQDHVNKGTPLVIYASLIPEQERIAKLCKQWGLKVGLINSTVSAKKRAQIDIDFQAGKLDCIVGSPATAAVGFNWNHCDHVIFFSMDYENINFVQAYRRMIRGERENVLLISVLEYEHSIDQRIFDIIDRKSRDLSKVDATYEKLTLSVK